MLADRLGQLVLTGLALVSFHRDFLERRHATSGGQGIEHPVVLFDCGNAVTGVQLAGQDIQVVGHGTGFVDFGKTGVGVFDPLRRSGVHDSTGYGRGILRDAHLLDGSAIEVTVD
ncbi:hypothetical protein D3C78_1489300 [compost metagenome]